MANLLQFCEGVVVLESFTNLAHVADLVAVKTVLMYCWKIGGENEYKKILHLLLRPYFWQQKRRGWVNLLQSPIPSIDFHICGEKSSNRTLFCNSVTFPSIEAQFTTVHNTFWGFPINIFKDFYCWGVRRNIFQTNFVQMCTNKWEIHPGCDNHRHNPIQQFLW